jgi:hypothetical protein
MSQSRKLKPDEPIPELDELTVGDFWSWAYSDILSNANRGVFAEFLVGVALGVIDEPRIEWNGFDLRYQGKKIEIKSSGYLQTWRQKKLSTIIFDISAKRAYDEGLQKIAAQPVREADCYVFCLYAETDRKRVNVLDIAAWEFYVISTDGINQSFGNQKSVRLNSLRKLTAPINYHQIRASVDQTLGL